MSRNHIAEIDLIRLFAAISVFAFHLSWQNPAMANVLPWGWVGVEIFFVISGLVIGQSAFNSTARRFLSSRFFRLVPTACLCAVICEIALQITPASAYSGRGIWVDGSLEAFIGSLLLVYPKHIASAYWTLPIEIAFYGVIFLFLLVNRLALLDRFFRFALIVSTIYLHLLLADVFQWVDLGFLDFGYGLKNMLLLRHIPFFAIGYLLYVSCIRKASLPGMDRLLAGLAVYLCLMEIIIRARQLTPNFYYITDFNRLAISAATVFVLSLYLIARFAMAREGSALVIRHAALVRMLGLMTYPIYLLHETIGGATLHFATLTGMPEGVGMLIAAAAIVSLAWLVVMIDSRLKPRQARPSSSGHGR